MIIESTHLAYILISVAVTVWVATTLSRHGLVFLLRRYRNKELANSLSHLLSVGFYLVHIGCILLALRLGGTAETVNGAIELLSTKVGVVLLVLAASHFLHFAGYSRLNDATVNLPDDETIVVAETT